MNEDDRITENGRTHPEVHADEDESEVVAKTYDIAPSEVKSRKD